jgi:hypothetical protein
MRKIGVRNRFLPASEEPSKQRVANHFPIVGWLKTQLFFGSRVDPSWVLTQPTRKVRADPKRKVVSDLIPSETGQISFRTVPDTFFRNCVSPAPSLLNISGI